MISQFRSLELNRANGCCRYEVDKSSERIRSPHRALVFVELLQELLETLELQFFENRLRWMNLGEIRDTNQDRTALRTIPLSNPITKLALISRIRVRSFPLETLIWIVEEQLVASTFIGLMRRNLLRVGFVFLVIVSRLVSPQKTHSRCFPLRRNSSALKWL